MYYRVGGAPKSARRTPVGALPFFLSTEKYFKIMFKKFLML